MLNHNFCNTLANVRFRGPEIQGVKVEIVTTDET